jgi:hypothetical protein
MRQGGKPMPGKKFHAARHTLKSLWWLIKLKFQRLPLLGEIDGKTKVPAARITSREFGVSSGLDMAVEIRVHDKKEIPDGVGQIVKRKLFSDRDLIFNVCFSCGKGGVIKKGLYTDPCSHWFNVFFGYYEIDVPAAKWGRPFGYDLKNGNLSINFDDMCRIGIADWNWFSNYLYGVPKDFIKPWNNPEDPDIEKTDKGRITIGNRYWDQVEVDKFTVASAYTAPKEEHLLDERSIWTALWRLSYGRPHPRKAIGPSFFPCKMKARFYMYFDEKYDPELGERAYRTFIFGGTINHDSMMASGGKPTRASAAAKNRSDNDAFNERFLDEQMKAVTAVIESTFSHLGFSSARR